MKVTYDFCCTAVLSEGRLADIRVERWDMRSSDISYRKEIGVSRMGRGGMRVKREVKVEHLRLLPGPQWLFLSSRQVASVRAAGIAQAAF